MNDFDYQQTNSADSSVNMVELVYKLFDKIILIILAAAIGAGIMGTVSRTGYFTSYTSTSKLNLFTTEDETVSVTSLQAMYYLVYDYLEVFKTKELHQRVSEEVDLKYTADELSEMVKTENTAETHIINITVTAKTPEEAELLANTYADVAASFVEEKFSAPKPRIFERATPAARSSSSNTKTFCILGAMGGLFVACIAVLLSAVFDDRVYTPEDLQRAVGIETLGIMTKQKDTTSKRRSK